MLEHHLTLEADVFAVIDSFVELTAHVLQSLFMFSQTFRLTT